MVDHLPIHGDVYLVPCTAIRRRIDGASGFPGGITNNDTNNVIRHRSVDSFILEVPITCLLNANQDPVIGAWTGIRELIHIGDDHVAGFQLSRLGSPLVNEVVIGLPDKGLFNREVPINDAANFGKYVFYPTLPEIINILFLSAVNSVLGTNYTTLAPTNFPRMDLVAAFLTGVDGINQPPNVVASEMLRLNTSIPPTPAMSQSNLGVLGGDTAGFPNGRRPGDDVVDIALRVVMGALCYTGLGLCTPGQAVVGQVPFIDGAPVNSSYFTDSFPFLLDPLPGSPVNPIC